MRDGNIGVANEASLRQTFSARPDIVDKILKLNPGQFTDPIRDKLSGKWYIFKVNNKRDTPLNLTLNDARQTIVDAITKQRQEILLNALTLVAIQEGSVKNLFAERIWKDPKAIVGMRPSALLEAATKNPQQQSQPRTENENSAAQSPAATTNSSAASNANSSAAPNANR